MELLLKTAVMLLFMAFLSVRSSAEAQLAIVALAKETDLSKVSSLRIVVPRDETTGRAVITVNLSDFPELESLRGVSEIRPAHRATLEVSQDTLDLREAIQRLGGVVVHRYANAPLLSVVVPADRFSELKSLPGVTRVRKPKIVTPSHQ